MIEELTIIVIGLIYGASCLSELPTLSYSYCTDSGLIEHKIGQDLQGCIELCVNRRVCLSISYNRFNKLCTLRNIDDEPAMSDGQPKCIHVTISSINIDTLALSDGCSSRQCEANQVCISNLQNGSHHECATAYCLVPPHELNATVIARKTVTVGESNVFICDNGFTGFGHSKINCLSNGKFSETNFKCYRDCPSVTTITEITNDVTIISMSSCRMTVNTTVTMSCRSITDDSLIETTIKCNELGEWSQFSCIALCPFSTLPLLDNGSPVINDMTEMKGAEVEYICDDGFSMSTGSSRVICKDGLTWSILTVTCSVVKNCERGDLKVIDNSYPNWPWEPMTGANYIDEDFDTNATFKLRCKNDFTSTKHVGASLSSPVDYFAICQSNGAWEYVGGNVICMSNCENPHDNIIPVNTVPSTVPDQTWTPGSVFIFICIEGFSSENLIKTCVDGEWVGDINCQFNL